MDFIKKIYWLIFTTVFSVFILSIKQCYNNSKEETAGFINTFFNTEDTESLCNLLLEVNDRKTKRDSVLAKLSKKIVVVM